MPQRAWSDKRERQYEHIKEGLRKRGESEDKAEEIAARTVNKERALALGRPRRRAAPRLRTSPPGAAAGCARTAGRRVAPRTSFTTRRGQKGIEGRSKMNKAELERAVGR